MKKKVLILGGIKQMIEVVEAAKRMGLYTIVADNGFGASAKQHADQSYDFSPSQIAHLAKIAIEEKIEGVFTSVDDVNIWNALKLCKTAGLPLYATQEQLEIPAIRDKFLDFCRTFKVRVIKETDVQKAADLHSEKPAFSYDLVFFSPLNYGETERQKTKLHDMELYYTLHKNKQTGENPRSYFSFKRCYGKCPSVSMFEKSVNEASSNSIS